MDDKGFEAMNVVPLVDVLMVLLVIVLMTSTFIASGMIPVELPRAATARQEITETVLIVIDRSGKIHFDSKPTTLSELAGAVEKIDRRTQILIRADRFAMVQVCVDVLDLLANNRFEKVALQTERNRS